MDVQIIRIIVFGLIPRIILTLSIYCYDKSKCIEKKKSSYVLAFLFGYLYIIGRLITKKGTRTDSPDKKYKNRSIALFVIYLLFLVSSYATSYIIVRNADHYFDMYGNGYNRWDEVVYYTEDGTGYVMDRDDYCFVEVDDPDHKTEDLDYCYVDKNGYLVFIDYQMLNYDETVSRDDPYCFYDSDNNYYADARFVYWNENGEQVDYRSAYKSTDNFIERLKPYIDKLIEKQKSRS